MNKLTPGSNMMLLEHIKALKAKKNEQTKVPKPILDDQ